MKYCPKFTSTSHFSSWHMDSETYCPTCGTELTPEIRCLCGKMSFNPMSVPSVKFCSACGVELTDAYLGRCMSTQLKGMVSEIAKKHGANGCGE